ncbi:hypothetical protein QWZ06_18715 [Chryseobacterium tructae]|uniref:Lipoprotein n=1 Tax=Chryseobacterium tructae TaxID=1037380 RepID=A0ABV7Y023_9FLAO|nr:hypothetical protein [Chryseobacterium tructae]MDN3694161.1 hypothetical protein [Chryseobacterium tructae]
MMKTLSLLFASILLSCNKQESKMEGRKENSINHNSLKAQDTLVSSKPDSKTAESTGSSSVNSQYVSLPFDYEKYKKTCIQEGSLDCSKMYPVLGQSESARIIKIMGITEASPESIFQIQPVSGSNIDIYVLNFEGDSNSQEIVSVYNNKVVSRQSIGYAMPEEDTYEAFIINTDMTIDIYEISFADSSKKKKREKYKILANGNISKI